eukprot:GHVT01020319.1.p1 GENE.GHVT01020319.1~~GHVT01020319.1.p1  ORF type:complete len:342 (-),score=34.88 GHVT01020319.1:7-1032(-)
MNRQPTGVQEWFQAIVPSADMPLDVVPNVVLPLYAPEEETATRNDKRKGQQQRRTSPQTATRSLRQSTNTKAAQGNRRSRKEKYTAASSTVIAELVQCTSSAPVVPDALGAAQMLASKCRARSTSTPLLGSDKLTQPSNRGCLAKHDAARLDRSHSAICLPKESTPQHTSTATSRSCTIRAKTAVHGRVMRLLARRSMRSAPQGGRGRCTALSVYKPAARPASSGKTPTDTNVARHTTLPPRRHRHALVGSQRRVQSHPGLGGEKDARLSADRQVISSVPSQKGNLCPPNATNILKRRSVHCRVPSPLGRSAPQHQSLQHQQEFVSDVLLQQWPEFYGRAG